jgi:hypothetical protein
MALGLLELDMVLTAPKDIQEVENYLLLKAMVAWEAKHETVATVAHAPASKHVEGSEVKEEGARNRFC